MHVQLLCILNRTTWITAFGFLAITFPLQSTALSLFVAEYAEDFSEFDETAIASASLAQVYRARLRANNQLVAVKVQRPEISKVIDADLELMVFFAKQLHERVRGLKPYDLPGVAAALRDAIDDELDFENEARNL